MSLINAIPSIKKNNWDSAVEFSVKTRQALQTLAHLRLGVDSTPTFAGTVITGLTASRLTATNSAKNLVSVSDLTSWVAGTSNRVTVADDGDGTITLSGPQDIHTGASPTFANLSLGTGELTCGSINRVSGTLTIEIGGTAEISITSSAITLGGNLIIPDNGYIGSVSDTDSIQINSTGNVAFTQIARGIFPIAGDDIATKEYVDLAVGSSFDLFLSNTDDGVVANTHVMFPIETGEAQSTETSGTLTQGVDDQLALTWLSEAGVPGTLDLRTGVYDAHIHLNKNAGGATTDVYWTLSFVDADGSSNETLVVTSEIEEGITTSATSYDIHAVVGAEVITGVTKRLLFKIYANISNGQNVTLTATLEGTTDAHVTFMLPSSVWQHHGDVLDDINILGQVGADSEFLVGTGAGTFAWESGTTVRTSLGLGIGDSPQFTGIELGHVSDTTITRASAGDLNVENNIVYRAGGTDVPIGDGGTGQSTAQAAIDALSAVSGATDEHVLTKDTASGNAVWKESTGFSEATTQTVNLLDADSTAEKQTKIDAIPKYIPNGQIITFQFEASNTHVENAALEWVGFYGGGTINIYGDTSEGNNLYNTQNTILDFTSNDANGLYVYQCLTRVLISNLKIMVKDNVQDVVEGDNQYVSGIYARSCWFDVDIRYNYILGSGTVNSQGIFVQSSSSLLVKNYVSNVRYGISVFGGISLANGNDDTGTQPAYGLRAYNTGTLGKKNVQPSGSVANELEQLGGAIRA